MAIKIKFHGEVGHGEKYKLNMDYDKYANSGDIHWQWYADNKNGYKTLVDESLRQFEQVDLGTVIDVGCGDGLPMSALNNMGHRASGVDSSEIGVKLAVQHKVAGEIFIETAEKFAKRGLEFDYLYSLNTIEHLDDPAAMVEIMRHVKNFGIIVTDNIDVVPESKRSVYHNIEFNPASFEKLFAEFNFERINLSDPGYFGYKVWKKI